MADTREQRIVHLMAHWLAREPEWTIAMARMAAEWEDAIIYGTGDAQPIGFLNQPKPYRIGLIDHGEQ